MSTLRKRAVLIGGTLLALVVVWTGYCFVRAGQDGTRARAELVAAEKSLQARDIPGARAHLARANRALDGVESSLSRLGPIGAVARVTPLVRVQVRGIEAYVDAGRELTSSASRLTDALDGLLHPTVPDASLETTLDPLRQLDATLRDGLASLDRAAERINTLNGYRLIGPLDGARRDLAERLPVAHQKALEAEQATSALLSFVGGNGPRRYLVLAQNPDEVRPTGGFIGSYGVLEADGAKVRLDRFEGIETWIHAHPDVVVPPDEEAAPFRYAENPASQQGLGNVNASIDFPADAELAQRLWAQAGEPPVDGVLMITPDLLVRVLRALGPVQVPEYGETITAANLLERLDFHTHEEAPAAGTGRKEFLAALSQPVLKAMLHAPSDRWVDLGEQLVDAGDAREMMAWSSDANVEDVLAQRAWDGTLPEVTGDFFANGDFEYVAKNGRALQRTFDHVVTVHPDGSGTVETTITLANPLAASETGKLNIGATIYSVLYGPPGATLDPSADEPAVTNEVAIDDHPGVGYALAAPPQGSDTVKVVWTVPDLLEQQDDGTWRYSLRWRHVATNGADVLHLDIRLPEGWSWTHGAPPSSVRLDHDVDGGWDLQHTR